MSPPSSRDSSVESDHRDAMDDVRTTSVFTALSSFFMSEKFSDMKITCGDGIYSVHRVVVCGQSPFFDKALSGTFKEAATATVDLPEDNPDILEKFLEYLYTGNYDDKVVLKLNTPANVALIEP